MESNLKARAFAAYLGSSVFDSVTGGNGILDTVCITDLRPLTVCLRVDGGFVYKTRKLDDLKLSLKSLYEITNNDAIEVAKIIIDEEIESIESKIDYDFVFRSGTHTYKMYIYDDGVELGLLKKSEIDNSEKWDDCFIASTLISQAVDYLRSKSYNLPFMGVSLIESGIAKLKTEK